MPRGKKKAEDAELITKQNENRDHKGKYSTPKKAIPSKNMRQFLTSMRKKHGDVPISYILAHYDSMMNDNESDNTATKVAMTDTSSMTVPDVLDALFKADTEDEFDIYALLRFDDYNGMAELHRIQELVKEKLPYPWIDWEDLGDLHVTLTYFMDASPMEAAEISEYVGEIKPVNAITVKSGTVFEPSNGSDGRYVLVLSVDKTPELQDMQRKLYELCHAFLLEPSEYSNPDSWRPHITLGYSEEPVDENVLSDLGGFSLQVSKIDISVDRCTIGESMKEGDESEKDTEYKYPKTAGVYSTEAERAYLDGNSDVIPNL